MYSRLSPIIILCSAVRFVMPLLLEGTESTINMSDVIIQDYTHNADDSGTASIRQVWSY